MLNAGHKSVFSMLKSTVVWINDCKQNKLVLIFQKQNPEFKVDTFTAYGKWMDGWETRRKRTPGNNSKY